METHSVYFMKKISRGLESIFMKPLMILHIFKGIIKLLNGFEEVLVLHKVLQKPLCSYRVSSNYFLHNSFKVNSNFTLVYQIFRGKGPLIIPQIMKTHSAFIKSLNV